MKMKVFITRMIPEEGFNLLKQNFEVKINEEDKQLSKEDIINGIKGYDALLCLLSDKIDKEIIESTKELKVISNYAVGYDNIDIKEATKKGIVVCNTPGVLTNATADLVWALILGVSRRIVEADHFTREGKFKGWEPLLMRGYDVYGKTLGIIGMGRIGRAVAKRAIGFSMKVLYYDIKKLEEPEEKLLNAQFTSLSDLLRQADFISLHIPLSESTYKLLGINEFKLMKKTAIFINTSRGQVIEEEALVEALERNLIAGAGLDVYEREPQIHPALLKMNNVILLPHIGSATIETRSKMAIIVAENIINVLKGIRHSNIVNPEVWEYRRI